MGGVKEVSQRAQPGLLPWATATNFEWLRRSKEIQGKGQRLEDSAPRGLSRSGGPIIGGGEARKGQGVSGREGTGGDAILSQAGDRGEVGMGSDSARGLTQTGRRKVASPSRSGAYS